MPRSFKANRWEIDVRAFRRWVGPCEEGGVDSLWQANRLALRHPILECMSAMAAIARQMWRIRFGMNVAFVSPRDPMLLAKQCPAVDVLSEGLLLPAFGVSSTRGPELQVRDEAFGKGARRTHEGRKILSGFWSEEKVSFEGEFYAMKDASFSPRLVQVPLPLWIGGSSRAAIRRTAKWARVGRSSARRRSKWGPLARPFARRPTPRAGHSFPSNSARDFMRASVLGTSL